MKKLKLDLDSLMVDSFDVAGDRAARRGTVVGRVFNQDPYTVVVDDGSGSGYFSCTTPYPTNENTCQGSCYGTCIYTCNAPPGVLCA